MVKVDKFKELYIILTNELRFIINRIVRYTNKKRSKGLDLREESIVYFFKTNIKIKR